VSSTGQIVGGIVGGVIGFFFLGGNAYAGAIKGAAIGASIGGYIDPPPGPDLYGPTLDDKSFQSTAYGVSLATLHGSIATTGNIIYLENNEYKAVARKESTGGKGGGSQGSYTTTTYYATFAVALGEAMPGSRVRRIWAGGKLIYSVGANDLQTVLQSGINSDSWRYYDGSQTSPDSRMESVVGVGRTPSYEGTAYIIFYDFDLTDYGNGLAGAPIKVELIENPLLALSEPVQNTISIPVLDQSRYSFNCPCNSELKAVAINASIQFSPPFNQVARVEFNTISLERRADIGGSPVTAFSYDTVKGVSDSGCWYALVDDETDRHLIARGSDVIYSDSITESEDYEITFIFDLYFMPSRLYIATQATNNKLYIGPNFYGDLSSGAVTDLVGPGENYFCIIGNATAVTNPKNVSIVGYDGITIKSFSINLSVAIGSRSGCMIVDDQIHIATPLGAPTNAASIIVIDVATESVVSSNDLPITPSDAEPIAPHFSFYSRYGIYYIAFLTGAGGGVGRLVRYFYTVEPADGGVLLSEVCEQHLERSGLSGGLIDMSALDDRVFGYRFSGPGSARGALGQLQVAYLFDFVELGYQLVAVKRGTAPDDSVPWYHLDAREGSAAAGVLIKKDYETDSQLPSRYSISYLDYNREYDTNTQYADFPSRRSNERNETLALVMDENRAAQLADVLGNLAWVERNTYVFTLPQLYLHWKPGSVHAVESSPGVVLVLRINDITYTADQRLEINAKLAEPSIYQSGAVGVPALPPDETMPFLGRSEAVLMDIPMILDSTDFPGYVATMYGPGTWPGGTLFRSVDEGQTYNGIQAFTEAGTVGIAGDPLDADGGLVIDRESALTVSQLAGEFEAITEAQMMTGQHYCAYGMPGRWEILRYANAVLNSDGTKTLSVFLRGIRGTEWATALHQVGDYFVLLDDPDNAFIGADLSALMIDRLYKAVTFGRDLSSAEETRFSYDGVNLRPLSAVHASGEIVDDDWVIEWVPRTRYSSNFWVTGNQPQNEAVMAWQVDVSDGSSVVRTIQSALPSVTYTAEQQVEDFGSLQSSLSVAIYQISQRVGRGYPLEVEF
jgi:hypothetical protein